MVEMETVGILELIGEDNLQQLEKLFNKICKIRKLHKTVYSFVYIPVAIPQLEIIIADVTTVYNLKNDTHLSL